MQFDIRKPSHIVSLILLLGSFFVLIGVPILSFVGVLESDTSQISDFPETLKVFIELFLLILQILLFIVLMIVVPLIWYFFVNKFTISKIKDCLQMRIKNFDRAVLWGVIAVFFMFATSIVIGVILNSLNFDVNEASNIEDIANIFSPVSMFILVVFQPIGEEFFFRGFLLDKINSFFSRKSDYNADGKDFFSEYKIPAVVLTSILFGIAHASYGKVYPVFVTALLGLILGFVVVKTKSLYAGMIAHILYNVITLILYLSFQDFIGF